ncbi:MAG TPA: lipopolysaccharide biosynthesis protein [Chitinophagaceae bacterium]
MSTIRRQSIISSVIVYFGFALGFLNTYLFTRKGGFTESEYGLTSMFIAVANVMFSVASLGMPAFINKFFPYYKAHLSPRQNDMLGWAMLIPTAGFLLVISAGIAFKNVLIDKIFNNSPLLLDYYYWIFPFGFGLTIFMVLEAYAWQQRKAVLSNFLKEVLFRLFTTVLIVLTTIGILTEFDYFIKIYAFLYLLLAGVLIVHFISKHQFHLTMKVSKVTRRFKEKIITLSSFLWAGGLVFNVSNVFDTIVLTAVLPNGLAIAGVYALAQNIASLIQAPQRAIISASIGPLSQAWREKDYDRINRIYQRSSINQLLFSTAMFCLIWLNFRDGVFTFGLKETYLMAESAFFFIGLTRIIDMGSGANAQIIGTSTYWRFEFITGLILVAITLPLNYALTRQLGVIGPAIANLTSFTVYNAIRFGFLYRKFGMQPFTPKSVYTLLLAAGAFYLTYLLFSDQQGLQWIVLRSAVFLAIFGAGTWLLKLTPDLEPVLETVRKRVKGR